MKIPKTNVLLVLDGVALLTFIITFSPLVMPQNEPEPFFLGIPYTMWMGFLVSTFFVLLAYFVSTINKEKGHVD